MRPTQSEIQTFLCSVRSAISNSNYQVLDLRRKYMDTITQLGLLESDVINDIKNLSEYENWDRQTDNNLSYPGDVWICTKYLHETNIYIKLKIKIDENGKLLVMSYHLDHMV